MIAAEFGKPAPSMRVSPLLSRLGWRLEWVRSRLNGRKPLITRETALTAVQRNEYSNEKIRQAVDFKFLPVEETIRHFCGIFRDSVPRR
jgi:hypothetical protein